MAQPDEVVPTRMESADEIMKALTGDRPKSLAARAGPITAHEPEFEVRLARPSNRPPTAMLCILDDRKPGDTKLQGEQVRLRADRTVIARLEGDICIPHDGWISRKEHAAIVRQKSDRGFRWQLLDLDSSFGTFIRVSETVLRPGDEVLIGASRFRFEGPASAEERVMPVQDNGATALPRAGVVAPFAQVPSLVEVSHAGDVLQRFPLTRDDCWIGRDPKTCQIARPGDMLVSGRHARLFRKRGGWHLENNGSVNGVWYRVSEITLGATCQFCLGEQQFLFRVL